MEDAPEPHQAASPSTSTSEDRLRHRLTVRLDRFDHFPIHADKRGRCRLCKTGYTQMACLKCKVLLCLQRTKIVSWTTTHEKVTFRHGLLNEDLRRRCGIMDQTN